MMEQWHLPLLVAGLVTGGVSTVAALTWRRWQLDALLVSALAAAVVIAVVNETSSWWGVVAVLAAASVVRSAPHDFWIGASVSLAATALAVASYPPEVRLAAVAIVSISAGIEVMLHTRPLAPSPGRVLVLLAAPGLTWLCVPDTEAVAVVGAAVALPLILTLLTDRGQSVAGQFPFLVLLVWATADGFRGRPAGMAAAWVISAAVIGWPMAASIRQHVRPPLSSPRVPVAGAVVVVVVAGLVARTAGLSWRIGWAAMVGGAATLAVVTICVLMLGSAPATDQQSGHIERFKETE